MCAAIAPNNAILAAWKLIFKLLQLSKKTFLSSLSLSLDSSAAIISGSAPVPVLNSLKEILGKYEL